MANYPHFPWKFPVPFFSLTFDSLVKTNTPFSYYKQITLKVFFTIHIDEDLLGINLLFREFSTVLSSDFSEKGLLAVHSFAAFLAIHGLGARFIERREFAFLADVVEELDGGFRG